MEYLHVRIRFDHRYHISHAKSTIKNDNDSIFVTDYEFNIIFYPNIAYYYRILWYYYVIFIIFDSNHD